MNWDIVWQLLCFRFDNTPAYARNDDPRPSPSHPREVSDEEMRGLILFVAGHAQKPDPTLPRTLEARRVLGLVPDEYGAALFAGGAS